MFFSWNPFYLKNFFTVLFTLFVLSTSHSAFSQSQVLTPSEQALKDKYGVNFLTELKTIGVTAENYIYATKLTNLALQKYKDQELADARFLLEKAWSIIKSPKVLFYLAQTYYTLGDYVKARELLLEFEKATKNWKLTPIQEPFHKDVKNLLAACEKHLVNVIISCEPAQTQVFVNSSYTGLTPLGESVHVLPGVIRISLVKKGYKRLDIQINEPKGGTKIIRKFKLLTVEEDLRRTKLFLETEKMRRLALIKLEKERREKIAEHIERWDRINYWSRVAFITGAVFLGGAIISGSASYIVEKKMEKSDPDTTWEDSKIEYKISKYAGNTAIGLLSAGALLLGSGWYFYTESNKKLITLGREKNSGIVIVPLVSGDFKGFSLSVNF